MGLVKRLTEVTEIDPKSGKQIKVKKIIPIPYIPYWVNKIIKKDK